MRRAPVTDSTATGLKDLSPARRAAFLGLVRAHGELTRSLDAQLSGRHGLSLSAYEVLDCLARAPERSLRMTQLAAESGLSISRVSRLVDHLEGRGLVLRRSCDSDSRYVHVDLADSGAEVLRAAQDTYLDVVDDRYLGRLSCDEVEVLGGLLGRLHERRSEDATS